MVDILRRYPDVSILAFALSVKADTFLLLLLPHGRKMNQMEHRSKSDVR